MTRTLTIHYFARLREQRGCSEETLQTAAATPRDLYGILRERHRFDHPVEGLQVAVNDRLAGWDTRLADGDTVLFVPPVAGG